MHVENKRSIENKRLKEEILKIYNDNKNVMELLRSIKY